MSILSVDKISPIGSGTTLTLNATETKVNNFITVGTGASISSPSSNVLTFGTNSNEKARIDSSGRVLIGTATEGQATADDLTIATSGTTGITIRSGTGNDGNIYFSDGTSGSDEFRGYLQYGHSTNSLTFGTNSIERLRILSDGKVGIGTNDPQTILHINDNVPMIRLTDANASGTPDCEIGGAGGNIDISADINGEKADSVIRLNVDGSEKVRITSDGKIGINDTAPERTMDVRGSNCMIQLEGTGGSGKQWSLCSADNTTGAAVGTAGMFAIYNDTDGVAALRVSNSNYVLRPKLPYFYATTTPSITSNYIHSFGNVHGNNGNHYNNSNGRFTAPVDGFYWFAAGIWCNSGNNQTAVHLQLMRYIQSSSSTTAFAGANHVTQYNQLPLSGGTFLTSGDYVYLHQTGISIQGSTPRNYFSGYLVG